MLSITSVPMLTTTCELWVCADGTVTKFKGDVQAYKVGLKSTPSGFRRAYLLSSESHCQQHQSTALKMLGGIATMYSRSILHWESRHSSASLSHFTAWLGTYPILCMRTSA